MSPVSALSCLVADESAISSIEYAMLLALISLGLMAAVLGLGSGVSDRYDSGTAALQAAGS